MKLKELLLEEKEVLINPSKEEMLDILKTSGIKPSLLSMKGPKIIRWVAVKYENEKLFFAGNAYALDHPAIMKKVLKKYKEQIRKGKTLFGMSTFKDNKFKLKYLSGSHKNEIKKRAWKWLKKYIDF